MKPTAALDYERTCCVSAGKELVLDTLQALDFPGAGSLAASSPCELLQACTWLMASTRIVEAYIFSQGLELTVNPQLPYSILPQCYSESKPTTQPQPIATTHAHFPSDAWAAVEQTAHSAKRLHGKCEILQKQLQHECVRNITLEQHMSGIMASIGVHATPYEVIVAENPRLLQKHLDRFSKSSSDVRSRQAAVEHIPHFLRWAKKAAAKARRLELAAVCGHQPENCHDLLMPRRLLRCDTAELEKVP